MHKNIGILGFGIVGKSALRFLKTFYSNSKIWIWDQKEAAKLTLKQFYDLHDKIIISPGISVHKILKDLCQVRERKNKFIGELDIFAGNFEKPTVAITGTLGKTTITKLLEQLLNNFKKVISAGNIGIPMLDLVAKQNKIDLAVLELSSFQLALNCRFAPDIAIWTNFHPNHLDWHKDLNDYFYSKFNIFKYQNSTQYALFSAKLLSYNLFLQNLKKIKSKICVISENLKTTLINIKKCSLKQAFIFYKDKNFFCQAKVKNGKVIEKNKLFNLNYLPNLTFMQNWLFVLATTYLLDFSLTFLEKRFAENKIFIQKDLGKHRMELFATINGIDFYNDSKATVVQATQAAIEKLTQNGKPIILILGGISKGVDRNPFFKSLSGIKKLKKVFFFGNKDCNFDLITNYSSLLQVLHDILQVAKPGDQVLFSPSGASFDLFENYQERGRIFKDLVWSLYGCFTKQTKK